LDIRKALAEGFSFYQGQGIQESHPYRQRRKAAIIRSSKNVGFFAMVSYGGSRYLKSGTGNVLYIAMDGNPLKKAKWYRRHSYMSHQDATATVLDLRYIFDHGGQLPYFRQSRQLQAYR
jgi:hypothetical protein